MRVIIAGGGTGGHLFPAVALGEAFRRRDPTGMILFVGTANPLEISALSRKGFNHVAIEVEGLKRRGLLQQLRSLARIPKAFWKAIVIMRRFNPDIIIGVGGYASGPVALAARILGKKMVIHEQNVLPGFTNRILGRFAHRIFISFPDKLTVFKSSKTVMSGNPVRRELLAAKGIKKTAAQFTVLVLGGSQGAHAINCAVVEALDLLENPARMAFIHQTGSADAAWVVRAYKKAGLTAKVKPFFDNMADAYRAADLVICRAGATTVAEIAALGKPAIFIPYPFAVNNHQELNARYLADSGGAEVIVEKDLTGALLASRIDYYASNPELLQEMAAHASAIGRPDAADLIAEECRRLVVLG
ncbi:MAG: undecaprenyldiphospho-muramoylpentapeptide beta-N-acetylglucosaminyltransferase [Deltaproteobacteria bacterium]|nr:undecaprenyldiphospho-muramoylpentapeptide beta-N-acetylglucosaminyltransferase [Deltaproteobacteria bacterium]RLB92668.1 MAG: undecaprenyldiphospho-muramoylpentapeptide beta-N-acetylglucosaminyltransferase [Deltaproteobacteria bacterium]